ncbi:MAG: methylmalonyl Co-A mutase-associated GTPase MeaB, partial [Bacteroidetes bacterium]|nr:methylmalonyl Co-A mutase-associated GTPase MeaB [Bacteroidota bacterium]
MDCRKDRNKKTSLHVSKGIDTPQQVSKEAVERFKKAYRPKLTVEDFTQGILRGDITVLSRAITLVESSLPEHHIIAQKIIEKCLPYSGSALRIGVTGVPGVGKSTFIEA